MINFNLQPNIFFYILQLFIDDKDAKVMVSNDWLLKSITQDS